MPLVTFDIISWTLNFEHLIVINHEAYAIIKSYLAQFCVLGWNFLYSVLLCFIFRTKAYFINAMSDVFPCKRSSSSGPVPTIKAWAFHLSSQWLPITWLCCKGLGKQRLEKMEAPSEWLWGSPHWCWTRLSRCGWLGEECPHPCM